MKWQDINNHKGKISTISIFFVLGLLFSLSGITYEHTNDSVCDGLICPAFINYTSTIWEVGTETLKSGQTIYVPGKDRLEKLIITESRDKDLDPFIYKKSRYGRKLWINFEMISNTYHIDPSVPAQLYVPTIKSKSTVSKKYGYWRNLSSGDNIIKRGSGKLLLIAYPKESQKIKWSFNIEMEGFNISIDPFWTSYELLYKTHNESINIFNYTEVIVPDIYIEKNDTYFKGYNYTVKEIIGYEEIIIKDRVIGVKLLNNSIYPANINNDEICIWNVPIGDRDFINYPCCTELELNNSACMIIKLSELEEGILK